MTITLVLQHSPTPSINYPSFTTSVSSPIGHRLPSVLQKNRKPSNPHQIKPALLRQSSKALCPCRAGNPAVSETKTTYTRTWAELSRKSATSSLSRKSISQKPHARTRSVSSSALRSDSGSTDTTTTSKSTSSVRRSAASPIHCQMSQSNPRS